MVISNTANVDVPAVGAREPCPCGSGRRYKACHGRRRDDARPAGRPFAGLPGEPDWVALREIVPAATATVTLAGEFAGREVIVATVLPLGWPAMVRADGVVFLGLQVTSTSGDPGRDIAAALVQALAADPGNAVTDIPRDASGPRLAEMIAPGDFTVTVHEGFEYWVEGVPDPDGAVAASLERANATVVPTARLESVTAAYWARIGTREHLRWVLPEAEDGALDALVRLHVADALNLPLPSGLARYVGAFRADGLLVPVWDLPENTGAEALEDVATTFRARLDDALAETAPLDAAGRRARAGLIGRQVTLR